MPTTGVQETKDVIGFLGTLGAAIAGNPALVAAIKAKDPKAIGIHILPVVSNNEVLASGAAAFDGIGNVLSEIKGVGFLSGVQLLDEGKNAAVKVFTAYQSSHPGA